MNHRTKGRMADMLEEAMAAGGFRATSAPFRAFRRLLAPIFERDVPMERARSLAEMRMVAMLYVILLPILVVGIVIMAPFEILNANKVRKHNELARERLLHPGANQGQSVIVNYRIEKDGSPVFVGVASFSIAGDAPSLVAFTVHRGVPREAVTAARAAQALSAASTSAPEVQNWEWKHGDPYEMTERNERPW